MSKNIIKEKRYYKFRIKLESPLSISGSINEFTDHDVIKDSEDNPFIPGTSLAGAIRFYLKDNEFIDNKFIDNLMGNTDGLYGKMSSLIIYDLYFDKNIIISDRDGIELDDDKITKDTGKYDYQIIEKGAEATLRLELIIREDDESLLDEFGNIIEEICNQINIGNIRLGFKKNRGLGKFKITEKNVLIFNKDNNKGYIDFDWNTSFTKSSTMIEKNANKIDNTYIGLSIPLELQGGISIRRYSAVSDVDYEQITIGKSKMPVIPGSTWNGAIRHKAIEMLRELSGEKFDCLKNQFDEVWGYVKKGDKPKAKSSSLVFDELILKNSKPLNITRNKINRFDGSTVKGALYSEISYFGGTTELVIKLKNKNEKWILGLILLVIKDISNGLLAIGGQTSVGRGIFGLSKEGFVIQEEQSYLEALKEKLKEEKTNCEKIS